MQKTRAINTRVYTHSLQSDMLPLIFRVLFNASASAGILYTECEQ